MTTGTNQYACLTLTDVPLSILYTLTISASDGGGRGRGNVRHHVTRSSAVTERPRDASCHWVSLKIIQGHSKWHCSVGRVFFIETVCMSYRFWDVQRQKTAWPWNWGRGCSRSL